MDDGDGWYRWHAGVCSIRWAWGWGVTTYSLVLGAGGRDGALGTTVARVGGANDLDVVWVGRTAGLGVGSSESWEREGNELGVHLERLVG